MKVTLVTGNKRKIWQAESCLNPLGIEVEPFEVEVHEIQAHNPIEISLAKVRDAYTKVKRPLVVCDHSWNIPALKGFPGGYMQDMNRWFESEDYLALMKDKKDRRIILTETVVYTDGEKEEVFSVEFLAKIIEEMRGTGKFPSERVVVFEGTNKTTAEHIDAGEHARDMSKSAWQKFGEWYKSQHE
jgi:XTP/dITP diphosphohydrolase